MDEKIPFQSNLSSGSSPPPIRHRKRHNHQSNYTSSSHSNRSHHSLSHHLPTLRLKPDDILPTLDQFLLRLSSRLELVESYGHLRFDAGVDKIYSTLVNVRDSCSRVVGDSKRQARIFVETLEERYNDTLATRETLEQKAQQGILILEGLLADFESHVQAGLVKLHPNSLSNAWRQVDLKRVQSLQGARQTLDDGICKAIRATEHIQDGIEIAVEKALIRAREHGLITYKDLPAPWRVNPHIVSGYRFNDHPWDCLKSTLSVNNEVFNIWSHFIGLIVVLSIAIYFYSKASPFALSSPSDIFITGIFFIAACKCLFCSTVWHTFNSISHQSTMERLACIDYTGISLLVAASIITTEYTAFYCQMKSRWFYIAITGFLGLCGAMTSWHPTFNRSDYAWLRVVFYSFLAATGFVPVLHLTLTRGFPWVYHFYAPIIFSLAFYLSGAVLYALKMPERLWPGGFDYIGGSHNIWHVAVLGGIVLHYRALVHFFNRAHEMADDICLGITPA